MSGGATSWIVWYYLCNFMTRLRIGYGLGNRITFSSDYTFKLPDA